MRAQFVRQVLRLAAFLVALYFLSGLAAGQTVATKPEA
jgi:hypothetical protein